MNRRSFLRGAAAVAAANVVVAALPEIVAAPAGGGFFMGPGDTFTIDGLDGIARTFVARDWVHVPEPLWHLASLGGEGQRLAARVLTHNLLKAGCVPCRDPSVPMTGHLPSDDAGEEEELDADATTERDATIEADATGAGGGGLVQLAREPADSRGRERGTPCRSSLLPSEAGEVSASYADGGVESHE